ncbi:MAG: alpha/beta fold hydrolase [Microvirga sp.]
METASTSQSLPLLLLPGTLCDARVFAPVVARLRDADGRIGGAVIVGDMTGADSTPALAAKLLAEAPPRFALAGFSLGGIVGLEMIAQAPERIERIALLATNARPDPAANAAPRRDAVERARRHGVATFIDDSWPKPVAPCNATDAALRALIVAMAETGGPAVLASQSEVAIHRADSRPRLAAITVPALVLCGEDDVVCRPDAHREMAGLIPGATLAILPGAGHFVTLEAPDAVAAHLRAWLAVPGAPHVSPPAPSPPAFAPAALAPQTRQETP